MRLHTLPVSVAGVIVGVGWAAYLHAFSPLPAAICLIFAIVAQIASNFANEYYDFAKGLDHKGREGFRRGVTEGDLSARAMRNATYALIILDSLLGLSLVYWGGWWLIFPGIAIATFALAYSGGPWPLSHHGLGDVAVIVFFGIVPVTLTCCVQAGITALCAPIILTGLAIGLMGANVLICNNYRDADEDASVGKRTTVVIFGRKTMSTVYLLNGYAAILLCFAISFRLSTLLPALPYLIIHTFLWIRLGKSKGRAINPLLGLTAINILLFSILLSIIMAV